MKKTVCLVMAAILPLVMTACNSTDMSVYEIDRESNPVDVETVSCDFWDVREYATPVLSDTVYRLEYPESPAGSVVVLAETALSKGDYSLENMSYNDFVLSKYDLDTETYESGTLGTYDSSLYMSYSVENAVVGRYIGSSGDFTDMEIALAYDTSAVENSYMSFTAVFDDIVSGGVSQEDIFGILCDAVPNDMAEALVYGADRDGKGADGEPVKEGCLFEYIDVGGDQYIIGRDVVESGKDVSVQMYVSLAKFSGDMSLFGDDVDWEQVSVFEHYDGGYVPVLDSFDSFLPDFLDVGPTSFSDSSSFSKLFSYSVAEWSATEVPSYEYEEKVTMDGRVETVNVTYRDCMDGIDRSLFPYVSVKAIKSGSDVYVVFSDIAGHVESSDSSREELVDITKNRLRLLLGNDVDFSESMLFRAGMSSLVLSDGIDGFNISGIVQYSSSGGYDTVSYMLIVFG